MVRRAPLLAWLQSQNFGRTDFEAFWRLVGLDAALFVRLADEGWRARILDARESEAMAKALANASRWDGVAGIRAALDALRSTGSPAAVLLHAEADLDGWLSVCRNDLVVCSFQTRAPVADAYAAWGLAGALAGNWAHGGMAEWTLRLNEEDPIEAGVAIVETCRRLLASGNAHARAAASQLLRAHASSPAMDLLVRDGGDALVDGTGRPQAPSSDGGETALTPGEVIALGR